CCQRERPLATPSAKSWIARKSANSLFARVVPSFHWRIRSLTAQRSAKPLAATLKYRLAYERELETKPGQGEGRPNTYSLAGSRCIAARQRAADRALPPASAPAYPGQAAGHRARAAVGLDPFAGAGSPAF